MYRVLFGVIVFSILEGCVVRQSATVQDNTASLPTTYMAGSFSLLTYNIAGLPDFISKSNPLRNTALISPLLNRFDIVLLQEDFFYHNAVLKFAEHAYRSTRSWGGLFLTGDGLNRLSKFAFGYHYREEWNIRHGVFSNAGDVLAPKGFSYARHELSPGVVIDVYNLHMDAGHAEGDFIARNAEMDQLIDDLLKNEGVNAIIIAGDWNTKRKRPADFRILDKLITGLNFGDARVILEIEGDRVDRVLFRNGEKVKLTPVEYKVEHEGFADESGSPLSDHMPVSVLFQWEYRP